MITKHTSVLSFDTFVATAVPVVTNDLPPGQPRQAWSPITATLISGERDAVLVDPLMTMEQGRALADWVAASGKNLTTVYITHGHGDHWFGLGSIRAVSKGSSRGHRPGGRIHAATGFTKDIRGIMGVAFSWTDSTGRNGCRATLRSSRRVGKPRADRC